MTTLEGSVAGQLPESGHAAHDMRVRARRTLRSGRGVAASLTAMVVAAVAALAAAQIIARLAGHHANVLPVAWLQREAYTQDWNGRPVLAVGAVLALIGLVLLVAALSPGRPTAVALTPEDQDTVIGMSRPSFRRSLAEAALSAEGIGSVRVRLRRRTVRVIVYSPRRDTQDLTEPATVAVGTALAELAPLRPLQLRLTVRQQGRK